MLLAKSKLVGIVQVTAIMIVNYDRKTFTAQATGLDIIARNVSLLKD
jgi:hypothetical protein